jgi:hypothetical protein
VRSQTQREFWGRPEALQEARLQYLLVKQHVRDVKPFSVPAEYWSDLGSDLVVESARSLGLPLLVLQGGMDGKVSVDRDFELWKRAAVSQNAWTCRLFDECDHDFVNVKDSDFGEVDDWAVVDSRVSSAITT